MRERPLKFVEEAETDLSPKKKKTGEELKVKTARPKLMAKARKAEES